MRDDFLSFRRMLTPWLIEAAFFIGVVVCLVCGIYDFFNKLPWKGAALFFLGPVAVRVICESLIVFFRINETLTDIKNKITIRP
jgi:hypothetical protein